MNRKDFHHVVRFLTTQVRSSRHTAPRSRGQSDDPSPEDLPFVRVEGPVGGWDARPYPNPQKPMKPVRLVLATVSAAIALAAPLSAQEEERPTFAVQSRDTQAHAAPALQLRIEEALESHRRNRLLGNGLVAAGAAAMVGALVDWADDSTLGMSPGATGAMLGGMSLMVWGADRHDAAHEARRRAERWEDRVPSPSSGR